MAKKRKQPAASGSCHGIPWSLRPQTEDRDSNSRVKGQQDHLKEYRKKSRVSTCSGRVVGMRCSPSEKGSSKHETESGANELKDVEKESPVPARGNGIPWAPHPPSQRASGKLVTRESCEIDGDMSKGVSKGLRAPSCGHVMSQVSNPTPARSTSNDASQVHPDGVEDVNIANNGRKIGSDRAICTRADGNPRKKRRRSHGVSQSSDQARIKQSLGECGSNLRVGGAEPSKSSRKDIADSSHSKGQGHRGGYTTTRKTRVKARKVSRLENDFWEENRCGDDGEGEDDGEDEDEDDGEAEGLDIEYLTGREGNFDARETVLKCTVFAPEVGKVVRVGHSTALVVGLEVGERLCFLGAVRLRCGWGQAEISGYMIPPGFRGGYLEAHSPRWMSLLVINAVGASTAREATATSARVSGDTRDTPLEHEVEAAVARMAQRFPVVLALRPLPRNELTFLSAQSDADTLYGADFEAHGGSAQCAKLVELSTESFVGLAAELRLPGMQAVLCEAPGLRRCMTPARWSRAVDALLHAPSDPSRGFVLVCGAKGVGKSTFCRLLVNRLLACHPEVAFLDCDVGQPEFTAPGMVSLHLLDAPVLGPPHANIRRPELAYFVGSTTSKPDPMYYSAAVRSLVEYYTSGRTSYIPGEGPTPFPPLVVNTDGWVKGIGRDLLGAVIDVVRPLHIVQLRKRGNSAMQGLDRLPNDCQVHRIQAYTASPVPSIGPPAPNRPKASDFHTWRLLAYFMSRGEEDGPHFESVSQKERSTQVGLGGPGIRNGSLRDKEHELANELAARRPRRVPWRTVKVSFTAGHVPPDLTLHAVNGSLVGLVSAPATPCELNDDVGAGPEGLRCLADTPLAPCLGLGLVRSVDVARQELYVLTPEPLDLLRRVKVLVKGMIQLPADVLFNPDFCCCPYFSAESVRGDVQLVRKFPTQATAKASPRGTKRNQERGRDGFRSLRG